MVWGVKDPFFCWMINWECQYWITRDGDYNLSWKYLGIFIKLYHYSNGYLSNKCSANEDNVIISKHMKDLLTIYINDYASLSQFCHVASF